MVTVAGQMHETRVDRAGGIAESQGRAGHGHAAPSDRLEACEGAQELALPVALDAREPDDLARSNDQVDVREARAAEAADLQEDRRRDASRLGPGREDPVDLASGDELEDALLGDVLTRERPPQLPVAQDRHPVGDAHDLRKSMRHVDDRRARRRDAARSARRAAGSRSA